MTTEVAAHSLFSGPDRGLLENVVLRHDNGIITDISEPARRPPPARAPSSFPPSSTPTTTRARPRPRSARSACRWKAGSSAPRSARRSIPI